MVESEILQLYKYTIIYNSEEKNEYSVILVSDNIAELIELITDREMVDPMNNARKWFEITDFLWAARENGKWYHLFDINEQDLAVSYGYDVQEQYWKCQFKGDCPESVKNVDEVMMKFEDVIKTLHPNDEWAKRFASGSVLGEALYESKYVQDAIREKKKEGDMHGARELDAGIGVIDEIVKGEIEGDTK